MAEDDTHDENLTGLIGWCVLVLVAVVFTVLAFALIDNDSSDGGAGTGAPVAASVEA